MKEMNAVSILFKNKVEKLEPYKTKTWCQCWSLHWQRPWHVVQGQCS